MQRTPKAFTLVELLILVAILAVLTAIGAANLLDAQTRSRVARTRLDMWSMAWAVEGFHVDNGRYPHRSKYPWPRAPLGYADLYRRAEDTSVFTAPIAYIHSVPRDAFVPRQVSLGPRPPRHFTEDDLRMLDYWDTGVVFTTTHLGWRRQVRWALVSVGPDLTQGTGQDWGLLGPPPAAWTPNLLLEYDPANGTISPGNIYYFQGNVPAAEMFLVP